MRFVWISVVALILVKVVLTRRDCLSLPGEIHGNISESRYVVCKKSANGYSECDYSSVKVLKMRRCAAESIDSKFNVYRNVRKLDISSSNYTSLNKLQLNFDNLNQLNASFNKLTEIPWLLLDSTKQLIEMDFSQNQIKKLHKLTFNKVSKLITINISHNQIEEIDSGLLSELHNLEVLDLSDNKIEEIPSDAFSKNSKLKALNLKNNPIWWLNCDITQLLNGITAIGVSYEFVTDFDLSCANTMEWTTNEEEIIFKSFKTKSELRYPKMNFKNLKKLSIRGNRLQNALGIVNMLEAFIQQLDLSGNYLGMLDETSFNGLNNLKWLYLSDTNLSFTESNPFEHLNQLSVLDISHNNLRTLNISSFSMTLGNLRQFLAAGNHFENSLEIIRSLKSNIWALDLSQNYIGKLNRNTFEHFKEFRLLNLSDTNLEHFDVNPLKVKQLDISRNNLKRLNVTLLSDTLNQLEYFYAAENKFENSAEIIQHLGSKLHDLDLSGSYVGKLNGTTFGRNSQVYSLGLRHTNLSISDVNPFESVDLMFLDISNNDLTKLNFSTSKDFTILKQINLSGNRLTQLDGLTKHSYPKLAKLDLTNNELDCSYLSIFRNKWKELEIFGDKCDQFENNESLADTSLENTSGKNITKSHANVQTKGDEEAQTKLTIYHKMSASTSCCVASYAFPIIVFALIINFMAIVA